MSGAPSFAEVLKMAVRDGTARIHTSCTAIVTEYDSETQTISARLVVRSRYKDSDKNVQSVKGPILTNIPVLFPRSKGGFGFTFPLQAGDWVLLHIAERSIAEWKATGNDDITAGDVRRFDLSDAYAYPGGQPPVDPIPSTGVDADAMVLEGDDIRLGSSLASDFVALSSLVKARLDTLQSAHDSHTHLYTPGALTPIVTGPATPIGPLADVAATKVKAE